jgi:cytochrome c oxidase subunit 3
VLLGLSFTCLQAVEYSEAPFKFAGGGIYPSIFFLATGFHGFHVIVGTCFLAVCWWRARGGGFTPTQHFGFEAAAWYWHFVDVVWLFLFIFIYVWGAGPPAIE